MKKSLILLFAAAIVSCKKENPAPVNNNGGTATTYSNGILILDEGGFMAGNATVSFLHKTGNTVSTDIFNSANSRPLGDVAQSLTLYGGKLYIIVNNSQKIEVTDPTTLAASATISGFTSPRYMTVVSSTKAYVSDLFSGSISVVNPQTNSITGTVSFPGWSEKMIHSGNDLFVAEMNNGKVFVLNTATDQKTDSIDVAKYPGGMVMDQNGKIWVLSGGESGVEPAALYRIDPASRTIEQTFTFSSGSPSALTINAAGDKLYFLNSGVYEMAISASSLPSSPLVASGSHMFYNVAIDPADGNICVTDAVNFSSNGYLFRFNNSGVKIDSFQVGVAPSAMMFY